MSEQNNRFKTLLTPTVEYTPWNTHLHGYCVLFSSPSNPDITNEYFSLKTDFGKYLEPDTNVLDCPFMIFVGFEKRKIGNISVGEDGCAQVGNVTYLQRDLFGVRCGVHLDSKLDRDLFMGISEMARASVVHFTTGAIHAVYEDCPTIPSVKHIKNWYIDRVFLTPTPVYPKSYLEGRGKVLADGN